MVNRLGRCCLTKRARWIWLSWLLLMVIIMVGQRIWQITAASLMTTTKTVVLQVDRNQNGQAERGDTVRYTITLTNSGDTASNNVIFTDLLPDRTTLVSGSLQTTPLAQDDSGYSTVGNVLLTVPVAQSLLANDHDPDGTGGLTVVAFNSSSANGGDVNVAPNGSFTYNPPVGFSGVDTFAYLANDGEGNVITATAAISVGQTVWFINNAATTPGDGRLTAPFTSLAAFMAITTDKPGDLIFLYQGSGNYSGALTLLANQQLIGQGVGLTLAPNLAITAAARPVIANVVLAAGNTVRGVNINTSSGSGLSGNAVGALTINHVAVTSSGASAVTLSGGSAAMTVTLDSVTATGGTSGINLTNNRGQVTINGGTIQNTTSHAIRLLTNTGPFNFTLKNSTITNTPIGQDGLHLEIPSSGSFGAVTVQNNTFANNSSVALRAILGGTGSIGLLDISGNTFTNNTNSVELLANGASTLIFDLHDNGPMSGGQTQIYLAANDSSPNDGVGPIMTGHIRHNTITANPAVDSTAVWAISHGDGTVTVNIATNAINNFGYSGIAVEAFGGMGQLHATIISNTVATTAPAAVVGVYLRAGDASSGETSLLCANLKHNQVNSGAGIDYYLDRETPATTIFQLQGLSPTPATPAAAGTFVVSTDSAPPVTTFVMDGAYGNATCNTVSLPARTAAVDFSHAVPGAVSSASPEPHPWMARVGRWFAAQRTGFAAALRTLIAAGLDLFQATPVHASGETITLPLDTVRAGQLLVITFDVTIGSNFSTPELCNQATVSGESFTSTVTDDPTVAGSADPTCIAVTLPDTTPPDTIIDSTPLSMTKEAAATFSFKGTDNRTSSGRLLFACTLDGRGFTPCTSPQHYTDLGDGLHTFLVRAMDEMGNEDPTPASFTWNINPLTPAPDLALVKVNDVDGTALPGQAWTWTLRVTNRGDGAAQFADGQTLLLDNLPAADLAYEAPTLVTTTNITGTDHLVCTLSGSDLTCTAIGGPVTVAALTGAFAVQVRASSTITGDYSNPRPAGQCRVDPNHLLDELNEGNNGCEDTVTVGAPDLAIRKQHTGNFGLGQQDAKYTITVQNVGSGPSRGLVTVTDELPPGLTAMAFSGSGWSCTLTPLHCTRTDELDPTSNYPQITLTVAVANDAVTPLLNRATVAVADDADPANNMATDLTQLEPVDMFLFLPIITQK